ncbi:unnamed protein product [Brugia timori]|uniref:t-SNARE coiled-coil homology domain-containing protein n=1 Tax=Brugia timori TaxID=42155 RepID=A0A0R3Q3W8_9BILA|nr:unnamed protein product [Brugia timori]
MDDFILPEDIDEQNIDNMDLDAPEDGVAVSNRDAPELEQRSEGMLPVGHCAQAMGDTLQKYEEVKKRIAGLDQLAMQANAEMNNKIDFCLNYLFQLSFGMRLQAEMDKCATERRNFPLNITLKVSAFLSFDILQHKLTITLSNSTALYLTLLYNDLFFSLYSEIYFKK